MVKNDQLIPVERISSKIYLIREEKILLDKDLAELYGVQTKHLIQAVKRNMSRFPHDFMFQLSKEEFKNLKSQIVTSSWGGRRYLPYAFTEQGVAMLSSVLNSERAVKVNIAIMRAFVKIRRILESNEQLAKKLKMLEIETREKFTKHQQQISLIFEAINELMTEKEKPKRRIGF